MAKRININFDTKSIQEAIKQLQQVETKLQTQIPQLFLDKCLDEIIVNANNRLLSSGQDPQIIADIQSNWNKVVTGNTAVLTNTSDKAVFIEFGVGIVGEQQKHNNAEEAGYKYNIQNGKKTTNGYWRFRVDDGRAIDLNINYYKTYQTGQDKENNWVVTKGQPATMYLYNAMMDMQSSGTYKRIWNEVLDKNL